MKDGKYFLEYSHSDGNRKNTLEITKGRILSASKTGMTINLDAGVDDEFKKEFIRSEIHNK
jgi:hypothetical protein